MNKADLSTLKNLCKTWAFVHAMHMEQRGMTKWCPYNGGGVQGSIPSPDIFKKTRLQMLQS